MSIFEMLSDQLGGDATRQISRQVGADEEATARVISGALPMLMGALSKNASESGGAAALLGALQRDHDGGLLDNLPAALGQLGTSPGEGILKHVLGSRRAGAENALSRASGLDTSQVGSILAMLAPVVLGALGKKQRKQGLDIGGLTDLLSGERRTAEKKAPEAMSLVNQFLDSDGDGQIADDIARIGGDLLGSFLSKK